MHQISSEIVIWALYLWAAPYTLIGIVFGLVFVGRPRRVGRVLIIVGRSDRARRSAPRLVALTLGHAIIANAEMPARILAHELVHVEQFERWGPFYVLAYVVGAIIGALRHGNPYIGNPLEEEAFRREGI